MVSGPCREHVLNLLQLSWEQNFQHLLTAQIPVLESLLDKCDSILLGGGMIFTFYRAMGMSTGASLVEEDFVDMARDLMKKAEAKGVKLMLPKDVVVADKFAADAATQMVSITRSVSLGACWYTRG